MSQTETFDAVVVGSGAAGGWAAKTLCEGGARVAVIDAGRRLRPEVDFREHAPPSEIPLRGKALTEATRRRHPVQSQSYAFTELSRDFFVDDLDQPYQAPPERPFQWIRSRIEGGRTLAWGRMALRFSDWDLTAARRDSVGIEWPVTYAELAPYYDRVESFIGVQGMAEGLAHLPDGRFLPPMKLSCVEWKLRQRLKARYGRTLTIGRTANLTREHEGRAKCHYCGPCERGCITASYFNSPSSTLVAAERTGKVTFFPSQAVSHLTETPDGLVRGAWCVDAETGAQREIRGRTVLLCASTLESTRILLHSTSPRFPNGLGNESGVLGRYLMDHVTLFTGAGIVPGFHEPDSPGERPVVFYVPRFQNLGDERKGFRRGYGFQGASHDSGRFGHAYASPGIGAALKRGITQAERHWYLWLVAFGECLPRRENGCALHPTLKDRHGIPALRIDMAWGDNERAMAKDMQQSAAEILSEIGIKAARVPLGVPGSSVHEVGTARMGTSAEQSFLNGWNQSHRVKNLFVLDGAAFPSSPCQNPTLTIMALAARASDHLLDEMKRRNL